MTLARRLKASWALMGNLTYAAGQMVLLLLVARLAGLAELGMFTFALALTAPIQLGLGLSLRSVRVVEDPSEFPMRLFVGQAVASGAVAIALVAGISAIVISDLGTWCVVVAVAVMKALESQIELIYGEMQRLDRLDLVAASQVVRTFVMLVVASAALRTWGSALALTLSLIAAWSVTVALQHLVLLARLRETGGLAAPSESRVRRTELLRRCWPLGVAAGVISLNGSLPRIVTFGSLGPEQAGVFAILSYALVVMSIVGNSLGQTVLLALRESRIRNDPDSARRIARRQQGIVVAVGSILVLAVVFAGEPVLRFALPGYQGPVTGPAIIFAIAATIGGFASIASYEVMSTRRYMSHPVLNLAVTMVAVPLLLVGARENLAGVGLAMIGYLAFQWHLAQFVARRERDEHVPLRPTAPEEGAPNRGY
jgi:O-antigen/teichoic acid export membrane protein